MFHQLSIGLCVVFCILGANSHAISEQKIRLNNRPTEKRGGELSHIGRDTPEHHEEYAHAYPSYEFSYKVADPHTKDYKGQREVRNGDEVKGEYWLREPKGRKRTVKYRADKNGFKADVEYSAPHIHVYHNELDRKQDRDQDDIPEISIRSRNEDNTEEKIEE
ncbi:uncharacterized protein LOC131846927 [Achroia grisella]|uniref:uncharacterized protein LOC131846927 n=1 Tax=Achroia grisella TaxID=688607 RepID=UPI0027D34C14|nr:uncharacterized protein LOC131846927 [Achroia grisella]